MMSFPLAKHKGRDERVERRSEGAWEWEMMRMKDREEETRRREKSRRERWVVISFPVKRSSVCVERW